MLPRTALLSLAIATCLVYSPPRSTGDEEPPRPSSGTEGLSGEPSWFPLGGEVYHSRDRFKAEGKLLAFKPQPRWFVNVVRGRDPVEEKTTEKRNKPAKPSHDGKPPAKPEKASGPPLSPPKRFDDLPLVDQGATLSFSASPADSPDHVRFSLTLKAAERTVWREVEHRWTNTLPLLFAFYADGKAVKHRLTGFGKEGGVKQSVAVAEKGHERLWSLLVNLTSLEAILENRQPREIQLVAVFSERQHEGYFESSKLRRGDGIAEPEVPQTAIVVRSNVVRLKRSADHWEIVNPPANTDRPHRAAAPHQAGG